MKQRVRIQIDGEWKEVELEVDGRKLKGWMRWGNSVEEFVQQAIEYFTSHSLHQQQMNFDQLNKTLGRAKVTVSEMNALRCLGLKQIVARLEAIEAFEAAEEERCRRWKETKD
jgi:hypothetical protein